MKSDQFIAGFIGGMAVSSLVWIVCVFMSVNSVIRDYERAAIDAGVGEYYLDNDYYRQFRYIMGKEK